MEQLKIPKHLQELIEQGEHQQLDFKFEISSSAKIAKTLVAFSNTKGGKLLIGVKDNGSIAGIRSEEEIFMLDSAARLYSKPRIIYDVKPWFVNHKQVLEVTIKEGSHKPYFARDEKDKWICYVRVNDKNIVADNILVRYFKEKDSRNVAIRYKRNVEFLLDYLNDFGTITLRKFAEGAEISLKKAEDILLDLLILDYIEIIPDEKESYFKLR